MFVNEWVLVREDTNLRVDAGDQVWSFRGEQSVLVGGEPPRHVGSTGRVMVRASTVGDVREYFPGVFGLAWVKGVPHETPVPHALECA
jgi:hypothetical protein